MHAGLDRPDGNADASRDLRQWEAEVVVEDKDRALLDGEPPESTLELISVVDCLVFVGPVHRLDRREPDSIRPARATPGLGVARVCQDPVEPGLEEPGVAQRSDFSPRGQECRLDGVVSKVVVAQDPERDRHASVTGQASQRIEGLSIASLRLGHQFCVHPSLRASVVVASDVGAIGLESSGGSLSVQSALRTGRRDVRDKANARLKPGVGHAWCGAAQAAGGPPAHRRLLFEGGRLGDRYQPKSADSAIARISSITAAGVSGRYIASMIVTAPFTFRIQSSSIWPGPWWVRDGFETPAWP